MRNYTDRNVGGNKNKLSRRTSWGIAVLVCAVFLLFCMILNFLPFIRSFILGAFGLAAYPILAVVLAIGIILISKKSYSIAKNYVISVCVLYFIIVCVLQTALTNIAGLGMGDYLSEIYNAKTTPGGALAGIFAYGFGNLFNYVGAYILFAIGSIICVAFMVDYFLKMKDYKKINARTVSYPIEKESPMQARNEKIAVEVQTSKKKGLFEHFKKEKIESDPVNITLDAEREMATVAHASNAQNEMAEEIFGGDYSSLVGNDSTAQQKSEDAYSIDDFINKVNQNSFENFNKKYDQAPQYTPTGYRGADARDNMPKFEQKPVKPQSTFSADLKLEPLEPMRREPINVSFDDEPESDSILDNLNKIMNEVPTSVAPPIQKNDFKSRDEQKATQLEMQQTKPTPNPTTTYKRPSPYVRPPVNMLTTQSSKQEGNEADFKQKARILEETLASFKIQATVVGITRGPAVTRYEIQMPAGISVKKISQHSDDIAMMMQSYGGVRIEAPIPGKNLVGIEIPNEKIATIGLMDIINSPEFHNSKSPLTVALGKDIAGSVKVCDLAAMPHLLVAGSTGSGKSVCLNVILISLLYKLGMDDLRLILIDPKRVEFTSYNGVPHLLTPEVICQPKQALNAFDWAILEMETRFDTFQRLRVRDINEYNSLEAVYKGREPKLPRIVIIVDELADLMMMARKELEDKIMRIAQLSRAAGIHLILATQRPSVNVITGTIKANLPSRIAFSVNNFADSNTIINQGGAEKLLGKGDMLYAPQNLPEPVRIQCPYIGNTEVLNIVDFIKNNNECDFDAERTSQILDGKGNSGGAGGDADTDGIEYDPILPKALFDFIRAGTGSISAIQRRYSVGYARAARIVDQMEQAGFISAPDGTNKNRQILIDEMKYNELFSNE
ncbi:MAG: DUF87 domain-containing protein [Clostridia bacterium]|nr:DUF87 domain-containing protein [Clostridia bacterium]